MKAFSNEGYELNRYHEGLGRFLTATLRGARLRAAFIAFIIFAFEITRDYNSVLPLMLVTVIADAIAVYHSKNSIMTEKLARRGLHIHQDYEPDVFQQATVGEIMTKEFSTIPSSMRVSELAEKIASRDASVSAHQAVLIAGDDGKLAGIITRGDVMSALDKNPGMSVLEAGKRNVIVAYPDEVLYDAATRMLRAHIGRLAVVSRDDPRQVVGYLGRPEMMAARLRRLEEEYVREPGWWRGRKQRQAS